MLSGFRGRDDFVFACHRLDHCDLGSSPVRLYLRSPELSIFDKKGNKTKIADGVTKAIREEDGDIVYDSRHDLMLYQKEESERIGIGIVDFWYADEMKTEQNFRLDW